MNEFEEAIEYQTRQIYLAFAGHYLDIGKFAETPEYRLRKMLIEYGILR